MHNCWFNIVFILLLIFGKFIVSPHGLPEICPIQFSASNGFLYVQLDGLNILLIGYFSSVDDVRHDIWVQLFGFVGLGKEQVFAV